MKEAITDEAHENYVLGLLFTSDSRMLVSSGKDEAVKLWSTTDWSHIQSFDGHENSANSTALTPDGQLLVTGSIDTSVAVWTFPEGQVLVTLRDRKKTVSAGCEQSIRIWDTSSWQQTRVREVSEATLRGLSFSADERTTAIIMEGRVELRNTDDWALLHDIEVGTPAVNSAASSPDGRWLAVGAADEKIRVWQLS